MSSCTPFLLHAMTGQYLWWNVLHQSHKRINGTSAGTCTHKELSSMSPEPSKVTGAQQRCSIVRAPRSLQLALPRLCDEAGNQVLQHTWNIPLFVATLHCECACDTEKLRIDPLLHAVIGRL